jgi:hypothetical protein
MTDQPVPRPHPADGEPFRVPDEAAAGPFADAPAEPSADPAVEPSYPWDEAPPPPSDDPDSPRQRHDAFTEARKCAYLKALVKTGCILDACRLVGPSPRTVYRHQESDPRFLNHCGAALRMSGTPLELTAWQQAVEGVEQEYCVAGEVRVRRRYDANLLRLLLQGSNPKKYGPRPGFKRKRLLRHERKQMEREIRAEIAAETPEDSFEEAIAQLDKALDAFGARRGIPSHEERLAAGWTKSPDGEWVPPGYGPIEGWTPPTPTEGGEGPP